MTRWMLGAATATLLCASSTAALADQAGAVTGGVAGAVGGAVVGGPVGAIVGGVGGAAVGNAVSGHRHYYRHGFAYHHHHLLLPRSVLDGTFCADARTGRPPRTPRRSPGLRVKTRGEAAIQVCPCKPSPLDRRARLACARQQSIDRIWSPLWGCDAEGLSSEIEAPPPWLDPASAHSAAAARFGSTQSGRGKWHV